MLIRCLPWIQPCNWLKYLMVEPRIARSSVLRWLEALPEGCSDASEFVSCDVQFASIVQPVRIEMTQRMFTEISQLGSGARLDGHNGLGGSRERESEREARERDKMGRHHAASLQAERAP